MRLNWDWPSERTLSGRFFVQEGEDYDEYAYIRDQAPKELTYNWAVLFIRWDDETPQEREEALKTLLLVAEAKWADMQAGVAV